jgi:hypothetical protein
MQKERYQRSTGGDSGQTAPLNPISLHFTNPPIKPTLSSDRVCYTCAAFLFLEAKWQARLAILSAADRKYGWSASRSAGGGWRRISKGCQKDTEMREAIIRRIPLAQRVRRTLADGSNGIFIAQALNILDHERQQGHPTLDGSGATSTDASRLFD